MTAAAPPGPPGLPANLSPVSRERPQRRHLRLLHRRLRLLCRRARVPRRRPRLLRRRSRVLRRRARLLRHRPRPLRRRLRPLRRHPRPLRRHLRPLRAAEAAVPPPQSAPRQSAPRQSAPRPSAPRQSAPRQSAPRQSAPRQSTPRQSAQPRQLGADLAGEVQRWLIRSGARSVRREFGEQVRRTLGGGREEPTDVWGAATTEPPPDESLDSPECAWCPICRGARRIRESGPGLGSQLAGAGDAVASAVQEALAAFDAVLSAGPGSATGKRRPASPDPAGSPRQQPRSGGHAAGPAGQAGAAHPRPTEQESSGEGPDREPDDRR